LDILHHIHLLQLNGALHTAPLGEDFSGHVLDLGAGTGIWAMDMGDSYPSATIRGVDLSPTQSGWVPPNVYFEIDDVEEPWTYSRKFDYIHSKIMAGSIRNWPYLVQQCFDNLNPGGWVEFADWDYTPFLPDGTADTRDNWVVRWHKLMMDTCLEKTGATARPGPHIKKWVSDAGFEDVKEIVFQVPIGSWPKDPKLKEVGRYYKSSLDEGIEGISLRIFTQLAGMSVEETCVTNAMFRKAMKEINFYHLL
jgi:SAM-dependent methyltransferase